MTRLLILSHPSDAHFAAIDWALRQANVFPVLLCGNDYPRHQTQTVSINNESALKYKIYPQFSKTILLDQFSTIWYRRHISPVIGSELHRSDRMAAFKEAETTIDGIYTCLSDSVKWVNHPNHQRIASKKIYQLNVAKKIGLSIPKTLISNEYDDIRKFFIATKDVIYKPQNFMSWFESDTLAYLPYATRLSWEDIMGGEGVCSTANVFQEYIEKSFELRVLYLGGKINAYRLDTQNVEKAKTDWRSCVKGELIPEQYKLSNTIKTKIDSLMRELKLFFGVLDFVVDRNGTIYFLEVNPSGQFLFLESWNPELDILSKFCLFISENLDLTEKQKNILKKIKYVDFLNQESEIEKYKLLSEAFAPPLESGNIYWEG